MHEIIQLELFQAHLLSTHGIIQPIIHTYLHNAVEMVTHGQLWHVTHKIIQPVIQTSQNVNRLSHVSVIKNNYNK